MNERHGRVALITGASRGVGASVAVKLAERGVTPVIHYRSKGHRAEAVAERARAFGSEAITAQADLTCEAEMAVMLDRVRARFERLDLLILNASGGLEKDRPADYPQRLNLTAQVRAVDLALPLMAAAGRIVFVTSHPAHFYGSMPQLPSYEPVAASKHAGERALRGRIPELAALGISLVVVSGDLIEDTITAKLLERELPGLIDSRRAALGSLLTIDTFAEAVIQVALDPTLESGATVLVGDRSTPAL